MLRPLVTRRVLLPGGRVEDVGVAGLGGDSAGEIGPARVKRVSTPKGLLSSMHGGDRPYGSMGWGPPIKYVKIPGGEWGTVATLKVMKELVLGQWGHRNPEVILLAKKIVEGVSPGPSKNYEAMAGAILSFMKSHVNYELDPSGLEYVQTPHYTLLVSGSGDCFAKGTKVLLREGHRLVPIETLRVGDEIWGLDRWSRVENTWERGVRATHLIRLNNGSVMRLTPEHKVWVAHCQHHGRGTQKARFCACPVSERLVERVTVEDLKPHDVMLQPDAVSCGSGGMDPRRAFIEGLYVADGFSHGKNQFRISGKDGFPREEQKREVETLCAALGVRTVWADNAISVCEPDWAARCSAMGTVAWVKRFLSIDMGAAETSESLRGVLVDSGRNTHGAGRTFTTSSRDLHLQVRVMLKSLGVSCSERFVSDHGSTSQYPVWRLGIRGNSALDGLGVIRDRAWRTDKAKLADPSRKDKLLRVKEVIRDEVEADCFDVATDDHYVWLPEADWSVSNCDDQATATCALAMALGFRAAFRTVKGERDRPDQWSHVYAVIGIQSGKDDVWLTADSTQKESYPGWDPPEGKLFGMKTWVIDPQTQEAPVWL